MSFVLKGFSFWELCKVSSPWLLLFYLQSWPFHESLIWIQKDEGEEKQEIDEIIKGAVQCPSSVHCAVHGINVWRIEEEGEEKKKEQNIGQYTCTGFTSLSSWLSFFFFFWEILSFGSASFFFFFRLARVPNNLVKKWEEKVEEKSKEDGGGEKKMGKQQI
jgi:hypothetical protein